MKITLCGSIASYEKMLQLKTELEAAGHEIQLPPNQLKDDQGNTISVQEYYRLRKTETNDESWVWRRKAEAITIHNNKIVWADAVLIVNETKHDIVNYIGGNTLMEMAIAFYLKKKLFLLNPIPDMAYKEEILGLQPVVLDGDWRNIN